MDGILICVFVFAVLICFFGGIIWKGKEASINRNASGNTPKVYTVDMSVNRRNINEEYKGPDYSQLSSLLPVSTVSEIAANLETMLEKHGSDDYFVIDNLTGIANEEFLRTHSPLLLGDEVILSVKDSVKAGSFKMIPCLYAQDGAEVSTIFIDQEGPAYKLVNAVKISGVYVADYQWWSDQSLPPCSTKLMVFYERNDRGGDNDEGDLPPGYVESVMFCLDQILKHNKNILKKETPEDNAE